MKAIHACPDLEEYHRFLAGQSSGEDVERLALHLEECPRCLQTVQTLRVEDTLLVMVRQAREAAADLPRGEVVDSVVEQMCRLGPPQPAAVTQAPAATPSGELESRKAVAADDGLAEATQEMCSFLGAPQGPDEIGRLGHYRMVKILGAGGMGVVFQAEDLQLKRTVALKALHPRLALTDSARQRFLREARAAAAIEHDHIVPIYQVGEDRGVPYLAMQFLQGETLNDRLRRESRLPLAEVLRIGREIAAGLAAAHQRGLVHRDIKPANIWLESVVRGPLSVAKEKQDLATDHGPRTTDSRVKILDFGLVHAAGEQTHLTQLGSVIGTPGYMAPEQAMGQPVDARSDLFSLGCVLYRMGTGRAPFPGTDTMAILMALANHQPAPAGKLNPVLPGELCDLIERLLSKDPERRPASAQEVLEALQAIEAPKARKQGPPRRRLALAAAFLAAAALLVAGIIYVRTDQGLLKIETKDDTVKVIVEQGGKRIAVIDTRTGKELRLASGEYRLRLGEDRKDIELSPDHIILKRGGTALAIISRAAMVAPVVPAVSKDDAMKMVLIPKGKFRMGGVPKEVQIQHDFYLGQYEVTQWEWYEVMGNNPSYYASPPAAKPLRNEVLAKLTFDELSKLKEKEERAKENYWKTMPVEQVSWEDAQEFVKRLNKKKKKAGCVYRLPTEAEWEYACRGGGGRPVLEYAFDYYFEMPTNTLLPDMANFNYGDKALKRTCKVGSYKPNRLGLYDMHGNVQEWCQDEVKDDKGASNRVYRGGSWHDDAGNCRAQLRYAFPPSYRHSNLGLRLARVPVLPAVSKDDAWVKAVQLLPPEVQVTAVKARLKERNPGFDGKVEQEIHQGKVTFLSFQTDAVTDLSPVRALQGLKTLYCIGSAPGKGQLASLAPLQGMSLKVLGCSQTEVSDLAPLEGMPLEFLGCNHSRVKDLGPLKGMPLKFLNCSVTAVTDLSPLQGMPLETLAFYDTAVADLAPLKGMRLRFLQCNGTRVRDLTPLKDMPLERLECAFQPARDSALLRSLVTLRTINSLPAAEFWKPVVQVENLIARLKERNPGFDGKVDYETDKGVVTSLNLGTDAVKDLSPLRILKNLKRLHCIGSAPGKGQLSDLSPLQGLSLAQLACFCNPVKDLSPLQGMPLTALTINETEVTDLSPLKGMPLAYLNCGTYTSTANKDIVDFSPLKGMPLTLLGCSGTGIKDLAFLKGMPLDYLDCGNTKIADLKPLQGLPLTTLAFNQTKVSDLTPLKGMPLNRLEFANTPVKDLSPLKGMPLEHIDCDFQPERAGLLRSLTRLKTINGKPAAEFWKANGKPFLQKR